MSDEKHEHDHRAMIAKIVRDDMGEATVVISHCKCGDFQYSRVPGRWELSEIAPFNGDADFLKSMGIVDFGCHVRTKK